MAPDDCNLERLRDEPLASLANGHSEKPEVATSRGQSQTSDKILSSREAVGGETTTATSEMVLATNGSNYKTTQALRRPIVSSSGQKINRYGSFEGQQQPRQDGLGLQANGDTKRPSTLSTYIVGKDWKNFGGSGDGDRNNNKENDTREESQRRKETEAGGGGGDEPKRTRLERVAKYVPGLGIIMSLFASLFLGTAGMLVKLTTSVHGIEVAVLRAVIQLVIYSAIIGARGIRWLPERPELIPVALRAGLGGLSITLSYSALKLIPLGDATTIRFSLPIWTMIMSYFFLRESCSSFKIFAVAISISGVVLVTKPDMCIMLLHRLLNLIHLESSAELSAHERAYEQARVEELAHLIPLDQTSGFGSMEQVVVGNASLELAMQQQPATYSLDAVRQFEGCLMALGSSICLSISIIALRLCKRTPSEVSIFWLSSLSILIGTITLVVMGEWSVPDNWRDVLYILLNGACGALGQWFMTNALKVEQSGIISLARTFDIEVAFLYSAFLLGEEIRMTSILGSILVSLGVVSVIVPKWLGCGVTATPPEDSERESDTTTRSLPDSDAASSHSSNGEQQLVSVLEQPGQADKRR